MTEKSFLTDLGLDETATIDSVEQQFIVVIKERIQAAATVFNEDEVGREEAWLQEMYGKFFSYFLQWAKSQQSRGGKKPEHPDAIKLKIEAQKTIKTMQTNMIRYSACYLHLNRFLTLLRNEIQSEEIKMGGTVKKNKWTSDTGVAIRRYKKQKTAILCQFKQMEEMEPALQEIQICLNRLNSLTEELTNREKADAFQRSLTAALRTANFSRAQKLVKENAENKKRFGIDQKTSETLQKSLLNEGRKLVDLVSTNAQLLQGPDNKLYLRPAETAMTVKSNLAELKKIKLFLAKYQLPYMQHKVDSLFHLKDKLLVVGSLESLMTLYKRLIMGIALPLEDIKAVRQYESEVVHHVKYLLNTKFQEVARISERARETVEEFQTGRAEFAELEKINISESEREKTAEAVG